MFNYYFGSEVKFIKIGKLLVHAKDNTCPAYFTERYGYRKYRHIPFTKWRVCIEWTNV